MSGFTLNEWINESPQTVFEALMNSELAPQIMHNIKSMTKLTNGDVRVGTQFREIRLVNGKEQTTDLEVIAYDAPQRYGVKASQSGIDVSYFYDLTPQNSGTQVDLECVVSTTGLKKLMLPIVAGVMKKEDGDHLKQIKQFFERTTTT
jgi:uncharacterized protein YndB with AHSA1/START domain